MKPIKFKEVNVTYAENQPEYLPLPVYRKPGAECEVVSCWKLTRRERLKILITGKFWLSIWTFGHPLQPILPTVNKTDLIKAEGGAE
ncbi:MAG TPA: hypothetical protein PKI68_01145 [Pontiellaceae bacterium]|nr:hypothetical protein [Pontiellaceae bacterium]